MDELLKAVKEMNREIEEMNQSIDEMRRKMHKTGLTKFIRPTVDELIKQGHKWENWYAWRPVKDLHGQWHWRKEIYRMRGNTYVDYDEWSWYHYGTDFDVLKGVK